MIWPQNKGWFDVSRESMGDGRYLLVQFLVYAGGRNLETATFWDGRAKTLNLQQKIKFKKKTFF